MNCTPYKINVCLIITMICISILYHRDYKIDTLNVTTKVLKFLQKRLVDTSIYTSNVINRGFTNEHTAFMTYEGAMRQ